MTWLEFADAIKEGKKIRKIEWAEDRYVFFNGAFFQNTKGQRHLFFEEYVHVTKLEFYIEPKPKQKKRYTLYEQLRVWRDTADAEIVWSLHEHEEKFHYVNYPTGQTRVVEIEE